MAERPRVTVLTEAEAIERHDAILANLGMTWPEAVKASLDYELDAASRGKVDEVSSLRFLLDRDTLPCCWKCAEAVGGWNRG